MKEGTYVYAVRSSICDHVTVFTTLEKAIASEEEDRNEELNPKPFEWEHSGTDMQGVEMWETTYWVALPPGTTARLSITKYPLDKTAMSLAGF